MSLSFELPVVPVLALSVFLLAALAVPAAKASTWGEPWGAFAWVTALAVPVPAVGVGGLLLVSVVVAVLGVWRFK